MFGALSSKQVSKKCYFTSKKEKMLEDVNVLYLTLYSLVPLMINQTVKIGDI